MEKIKIDKDKLYQLYVIDKMTMPQVAKVFGISCSTIGLRLIKYSWRRNKSEALRGHKIDNLTRDKISKSLLGHIPWNKGLTKKDSRVKKYIDSRTKNGNYKISKHLEKYQFQKGLIPWNKDKKFMALDENPNWRGGKSFEPYGLSFNRELKEEVRKRDNYRCQECFRHQDELYDKMGRKYKLNVHHIDYDKNNNNMNNLISLCKSCHTQTNFGREDWNNYFKEKIICQI